MVKSADITYHQALPHTSSGLIDRARNLPVNEIASPGDPTGFLHQYDVTEADIPVQDSCLTMCVPRRWLTARIRTLQLGNQLCRTHLERRRT